MSRLGVDARVSTRVIQDLKDDRVADPTDLSERALQGLAASLTRLATFLGISPEEALSDYKIDVNRADLREVVGRAGMHAFRNQVTEDETMEVIRGRGITQDLKSGQVNILVLDWKPFYESDAPTTCFARRYLDTLLGGVDPEWEIAEFQPEQSIPEAIQKLLGPKRDYDMLFGVYDTGFRRSLGVGFVPIPGISVKLDVLVAGNRPPNFDWNFLVDRSDRDYSTVFGVAMQEEAGSHILAGLCKYPKESRKLSNRHDAADLYKDLLAAYEEYSKRRTVFFIGDMYTCLDIQNYAEGRSDGIPLSGLNKALQETRTDVTPPEFPVGIGVRYTSKYFLDLLCDVTAKEMFGLVVPRVARLYVDLFWQPEERMPTFDKEAFEALVGEKSWIAFNHAAWLAVDAKAKDFAGDIVEAMKNVRTALQLTDPDKPKEKFHD